MIKIIGISRTSYYKYKKELTITYFRNDGTLIENNKHDEICEYAKTFIKT